MSGAGYATGAGPWASAVFDFDGDGLLDVAVANYSGNSVSILRGVDGGGFLPPADYGTEANPVSIAVGSVTADNIPDLIVCAWGAASFNVLPGVGNGSFGNPISYPTSQPRPISGRLGHLGGDAYIDLAYVLRTAGLLELRLAGGGSFLAPLTFSTSPVAFPYTLELADLNGDAELDAVVGSDVGSSIVVLLGNGANGFGPATAFTTASQPTSIAIGDMNEDGKLDLVVAGQGSGVVSLLLGDGTGSFGPKTDFPAGSGPFSVALGDVDLDGSLDVAVTSPSTNTLSVLRGDGSGNLAPKVDFATGSTPRVVTIADANGDAKLDVLVANGLSNSVEVFSNTSTYGDPFCPDGIVANGNFLDGLTPGSMTIGAVDDWSLLASTPQVLLGGATGPGSVQMWGNLAVGEAIYQQLPGAGIVAGRTYRVTVSYRWHDAGGGQPAYVRFRLAATNSQPTLYPPIGGYEVIGITPDLTTTGWSTYTFPDWTATNNASFLTVNPENRFAINDGAFVSWGAIDDICVEEVECGVVANGSFADGVVPGSMPVGAVDDWYLLTGTPEVVSAGCESPGALRMWGNLAYGESVKQLLPGLGFEGGRTYRVSVCYRWVDGAPGIPSVRFRLTAPGSHPNTYPPLGGYFTIGTTPNTSSTDWTRVTLPDWTPTFDADWIAINPENDSNGNGEEFVSWGEIDDLCVEEVPCAILANSDFTQGVVPGSLDSGGAVDQWTALTESPQVVIPGCEDFGALQMWGNQAVGESVRQLIPGAGLQPGKTYRVTVCYRWIPTAPYQPPYVRFRLCAASSEPTIFPPNGGYELIGVTPYTTSNTWISHTFPDWTPTNQCSWITINAENQLNVLEGGTVSWGQIDNVCIEEVGLDPAVVDDVAGAAEGGLRLLWVGPNPARGESVLRFATPHRGDVELTILDVTGARVHRERRPMLPGGYHEMRWNGRVGGEEPVAAGVYYYLLEAGGERISGKLVRMR